MNIAYGIFSQEQDLTNALHSLEKAGFKEYSVYGPEQLFIAPELGTETAERLDSPSHTEAGTITGITANPAVGDNDVPAQPLEKEFSDLGFGQSDVLRLVASLQQNRMALLVSAPSARIEEALTLLRHNGAITA
jgi:hypothetical protein